VGTALAIKLSSKGYPVVAVFSQSQASATNLAGVINGCSVMDNKQAVADAAELVFITTPDDVIASVASQIKWHKGQRVVHCSGADSTDILEPARKAGASVGVFHPLQSFASIRQAIESIPGSTFTLEAEGPLLTTLKDMANDIGGHWIKLTASDKVAYHASAVLVSNYLVTLVKSAADLWQTFKTPIPMRQAVQALLPLLQGTIQNIETIGIPKCLTGPIARGDIGTIKKHLRTLQKEAPDLVSTYRELSAKTIPIALAKGKIDKHQAEELSAIL
jgi:predicted short-subunit dehydrogenase-like oxidoreductase (DUF2520 family)